jgi:hypothetical protein
MFRLKKQQEVHLNYLNAHLGKSYLPKLKKNVLKSKNLSFLQK